MTTNGGGWTLVWQGIGGSNATSLFTTAAFNAAGATTLTQTFKFTDATINNLLTEAYMVQGISPYAFTLYMLPNCSFAATSRNDRAPNPYCGTSYTSTAWAGVYGSNPYFNQWYGIGDFPGNYGHFLTAHTGAGGAWMVGNGASGVYCNGTAAGCSLRFFVR